MRAYIFTQKELAALMEFIKSGRRNPTVNKILHYIKRNERLLIEIQLLLELMQLAHKPRTGSQPRGLPGRPPKILKELT